MAAPQTGWRGFPCRGRVTRPTTATDVQESEAVLLDAARDGDRDAYADLYLRHWDGAVRYARAFCGRLNDAEDLAGDAFVSILDLLDRGKGPTTNLRAYLRATIRHEAARRTTSDKHCTPTSDEHTFDIPTTTAAAGVEDLAWAALQSLPEPWQNVLRAAHLEGETPATIAITTGATPNSVAALAYRARRALRAEFNRLNDLEGKP